MNLNKLLLVVVMLSLVTTTWTLAADKVELRFNDKALVQMREFRSAQPLSHQELLCQVVGMSPETVLTLVKKTGNERGLTHYRYAMVFRGVRVWGEDVIITENNSQILHMHGNAIVGIENDLGSVIPAFDALTAMSIVKKLAGLEGNNWTFENEKSELVIYLHNNKAKLCYAVTFYADTQETGQPTRPTYIIDANTQEVLFNFEGIGFDDGTGPGGNQKTGKYNYGKEYKAFDVKYSGGSSTMENKDVKTVNLNHGTSGSTAYTYQGKENTFKEINGAYCPLNDAHFFGGVVFNMYKDWYNTAPLTFQLTLRVHYSNSYENAFWNGSSMTFGDGKSRFYPLISLDVVNHEVSHGFTEQNSGLIYSGQSGGINESFSDLAGDAAEFFMKNTNDFMVGAEIFKSTGALRYMDDPTKDGKSIGSAKNYKDGMDVHYSSGVFNKAFYVLAHKPGWNTKMAFDIFVKANQSYWTQSATFVSGAQGVVDAAKALGYPAQDVVAAFAAVDVTVNAD